MAPKRSIFFDDWRACLHAHYEYVVRAGDEITEPTLRHVLRQTGLSDDEMDMIRDDILGDIHPGGELGAAEVLETGVFEAETFEDVTNADDALVYSDESLPDEALDQEAAYTDIPPDDFAGDDDPDDLPPEDFPPDELPPDELPHDDPTPPRPSQLSLF